MASFSPVTREHSYSTWSLALVVHDVTAHGWTAHMQQCVSPPPAVHALTARVSSHAWLDGAHTSVRARLQPCMACSRASPVMHGWTDYMHQWESASTAMHGLLARVAIHTWLDGHTCISVSPPPAMCGLVARVSSHAWLDGACHTWLVSPPQAAFRSWPRDEFLPLQSVFLSSAQGIWLELRRA